MQNSKYNFDSGDADYFNRQRSSLLKFVPLTAEAFLEVGCGNGLFGAEILKKKNVIVWGVEPNRSAANEAAGKLTKVLNDFFHEELPLPKNYFDCIIFNDVLEHMTDPWAALEFSKSLLKCQSDIYIIGSIPNFRFWGNIKEIILQKDFNYKSSGILDKLHFRFFTFKSIKRMFEECGYEIEIVKGINEEVNWKFKLLNFLLFNSINDMRFLQFAFVAKPTIR